MNHNQPAITFDPRTSELTLKDKSVSLTSNMVSCLKLLIANEGQVITKQQIFEACWGCKGMVVSETSIRQVITHLRKKIQTLDAVNRCIVTSPRRGYILKTGAIRMVTYASASAEPCPSAIITSPLVQQKKRNSFSYAVFTVMAMVLTLLTHVVVFKFSRTVARSHESEIRVEYVTGASLHKLWVPAQSAMSASHPESAALHHYYSYLSYLEGKMVHTLACSNDLITDAESCRSLLIFQ